MEWGTEIDAGVPSASGPPDPPAQRPITTELRHGHRRCLTGVGSESTEFPSSARPAASVGTTNLRS
jgi:hypothetical protein